MRQQRAHRLRGGLQSSWTAAHPIFPQYPVVRIDRDNTRRKGLEVHLGDIKAGRVQDLIGTQMLARATTSRT